MHAKYEIPGESAVLRRPDELEFLEHINCVLKHKMWDEGLSNLDSRDFCSIIRPRLREFMCIRAVDAMEWVLLCGMGGMGFEQAKEDEIQVLCRYYNDFITPVGWGERDHVFMTVLNKYPELKGGCRGNLGGPCGSRVVDA